MKKLAVLFAMFAMLSLTACGHHTVAPEAATEEHHVIEVEVVADDDADVVEVTETTETVEVTVEEEVAADAE